MENVLQNTICYLCIINYKYYDFSGVCIKDTKMP